MFRTESNRVAKADASTNIVLAKPLLEYVLVPLGKRGFYGGSMFSESRKQLESEAADLLESSGAVLCAEVILGKTPISPGGKGELLFTGSGSALPCKHRNVSGVFLHMENENAMLLDVGAGTTGQLLRAKQYDENYREVLEGIKAVWVSHPHADHHLGILRLLAERHNLVDDPLVLIAPKNLLLFLEEYEQVDPQIVGSYIFLDSQSLTKETRQQLTLNSPGRWQ